MERKKMTRSNDRMIAGVCAGIADYFDCDPTPVRIAYVILTFFSLFSSLILYPILWIIMPEKSQSDMERFR